MVREKPNTPKKISFCERTLSSWSLGDSGEQRDSYRVQDDASQSSGSVLTPLFTTTSSFEEIVIDSESNQSVIECSNSSTESRTLFVVSKDAKLSRSKKRTSSTTRNRKRPTSHQNYENDKLLQEYLNLYDFYIVINNNIRNNQYKLGHIDVKVIEELPNYPFGKILYLYVGSTSSKCLLYWEETDSEGQFQIKYHLVDCVTPYETLKGLEIKKIFTIVMDSKQLNCGILSLDVYLNNEAFYDIDYSSEPPQSGVNAHVKNVIKYFFGLSFKSYPEVQMSMRQDIEDLYTTLQKYQQIIRYGNASVNNYQHPSLIPQLRQYQADAVRWMLEREKATHAEGKGSHLHPLFVEIQSIDGMTVYYNKYGGFFTKQRPNPQLICTGGILADEMGLGKTVEVLACILWNPRHEHEEHSMVNLAQQVQHETVMKPQESNVTNLSLTNSGKLPDKINNGDLSAETFNNGHESEITENISQKEMSCIDSLGNVMINGYKDAEQDIIKEDTILSAEEAIESGTKIKIISNMPFSVKDDNAHDINEKPIRGKRKAGSCKLQKRLRIDRKYFSSSVQPKDYFECICGSYSGKYDTKNKVQCKKCRLWQHAKCVKYDSETSKQAYYCPHCWVDTSMEPVPSRATLIVSPSPISHQWKEEIEKHIKEKSLKVLQYRGVQHHGFIQPPDLADYDIILTTYKTLRKEINYVDLPHSNSELGRRFRHPKRFMSLPSPLIAVQWWRICLDEAQMVESTTTKTAEMALRLTAINRWCVTGTPIQKTVDDLYGLLLFLGYDPYWVKLWWKELIYKPFCNNEPKFLLDAIKHILWRTAKKNVLDQIGIPSQDDKIHWLTFSPVEEHFYQRQHQECSREVLEKLRKLRNLDVKLNSLDRHTMNKIMHPLRKLRQACCHPQAVRGQFIPLHKSTLTMEELLTSLTKKAKKECEEAHRQNIAAVNGLAGIHIIHSEYAEAVNMYREVLRSVEEHRKHLKTDKLQQIHTLHNLAEVLNINNDSENGKHSMSAEENLTRDASMSKSSEGEICDFEESRDDKSMNTSFDSLFSSSNQSQQRANFQATVGHTLRDSSLKEEASKLRTSYLAKHTSLITSALDQLAQAAALVKETKKQFSCQQMKSWLFGIIEHCIDIGEDEMLVQKVKDDLLSIGGQAKVIAIHRFRDVNGLQYVVTSLLDELQKSRDDVDVAVRKLPTFPTITDVNGAVDCHLRPLGRNKKKCAYCTTHELFNRYEHKLFRFNEDVMVEEPIDKDDALLSTSRFRTWADSELESILKAILNFGKIHGVAHAYLEDGNQNIKLFEALKKEFRALRGVWMKLNDCASALDELDMATSRLRLRFPDEPVLDPPVLYVLSPQEVDSTRLKLLSDRAVSQSELRKKMGQLFYLQNLAKAEFGQKGGVNPDPCPVCQRQLGAQWSVLQCGHSLCVDCIRIMMTNYVVGSRNPSVKCPICRQLTLHSEISYIDTQAANVSEDEITVKGSHSTKVEGIVRCLLEIHKNDAKAKALVFSSWQDVLDIISRALDENNIPYTSLMNNNKFQSNLMKFKYDSSITTLLLPVHSGANGLNIIEASHVLLVEPLLNTASEQQAIGRIHRIGQTRPTTVHRFIVKNTIEERIHHMLQPHQPTMNKLKVEDHSITLKELQQLFEK